mmetsp:Transcript_20900/g.25682  ORF Transcript_20900/g.25682 Transcript_20900/m.25682 type:complete len:115 (+) Transcript_20900:898-1242(+)
MACIYSVEMFEHNSEVSPEFLSFIQGLLVPDPAQRLSSREAVLAHPFIQQDPSAVALWQSVSLQSAVPSCGILVGLGLEENVYVRELHNLIRLSKEETIDVDDDDDEEDELTAE